MLARLRHAHPPDDVRLQGKTGSHGWRGKPTRLTRNGHSARLFVPV